MNQTRTAAKKTPVSAPAVPLAEPPNQSVIDGPESWEKEYKDASLGTLIDLQVQLTRELGDLTRDYYQNCLEVGRYEELHLTPDDEGRYEVPHDSDELCTYVASPDGTVKKVVLPKDEFESAYRLKAKVEWLMDFRDRRAAEEGVRGY